MTKRPLEARTFEQEPPAASDPSVYATTVVGVSLKQFQAFDERSCELAVVSRHLRASNFITVDSSKYFMSDP